VEFPFFEEDRPVIKLVDARVARLLAHKDNSVVVVVIFFREEYEKSLRARALFVLFFLSLFHCGAFYLFFGPKEKREKKRSTT